MIQMFERENYIRNVRFQGPRWIPCQVHINLAAWDLYREELQEVVLRHPVLFPYYEKRTRWDDLPFAPGSRAGEPLTDAWGCTVETTINGIAGVITRHPLADWSALEGYRAPDPLVQGDNAPMDWAERAGGVAQNRARGDITRGGPPHGFFLMRLEYLRGFENLMLDIATGDERLPQLIELVKEHNARLVQQWLSFGVDIMEFGEDLGTQKSSIISPRDFRKWVTPVYQELMAPCRAAGCLIALHSDGYIMDLMPEFLAAGVDIINPQDLCNGIQNLAREVKGRLCIRLDIDRQSIVPFGTRQEIRELIEEEVRVLGDPRGGLEFIVGIYPPTPPENVDALCDALEDYYTYWWDGRGG